MINFNFLTPFQLTTFVLGIVFSILTIGMVFYTLRRPSGYRNTVLKVIFTFILPGVTMMLWFACVFAAYGIFESNELYIMLLSLGCGAAISGLTFLVAWLINRNYGKTTAEEEADEEAKAIEETDNAETTETTEEVKPVEETETQSDERAGDETVEETTAEENNEEVSVDETENAEENTETEVAPEAEVEENIEETVEPENTDESVEKTVEPENTDESVEETVEIEEVENDDENKND